MQANRYYAFLIRSLNSFVLLQASLYENDEILEINGRPVDGLTANQVAEIMVISIVADLL